MPALCSPSPWAPGGINASRTHPPLRRPAHLLGMLVSSTHWACHSSVLSTIVTPVVLLDFIPLDEITIFFRV